MASNYFEQSISSLVPQSDQQPFKIAFYNTLALVFLAAVSAVLVGVYHLLHAFFRPMVWAVLCGTVLFPFKKRLASAIDQWLRDLKATSTPFLLGLILVPVRLVDHTAEIMWTLVSSKDVMIFVSAYAVVVALAYQSVFSVLWQFFGKIWAFADAFIVFGSNKWVLILIFCYLLAFVGYLYTSGPEAEKAQARLLSLPIWITVLCNVANFFGVLRVCVFFGSSAIILLIVFGVLSASHVEEKSGEGSSTTSTEKPSQKTNGISSGNRYIKVVLGGCCLVWITNSPVVLSIFMFVLFYALLKKIGQYFGIWSLIFDSLFSFFNFVHDRFQSLIYTVIPSSIRQFVKLMYYGDQRIIDSFIDSAGVLSSIMVMVGLLLSLILMSIFFAFQVRNEVVHLVQLTSNVLNRTLSSNADWMANATKFGDFDANSLDGILDEGYKYGRTWLSSQARLLAKPDDLEKADQLEAQVKMLVDRVYEMYLDKMSSASSPTMTSSSQKHTAMDIWTHVKLTTDVSLLANELTELVKENVGMLLSILDTVWSVLSANLQFVFSLFAAAFSLILSLGFGVINFMIGILVFFTMIYYLLALSKEEWMPIQWIKMLIPASSVGANNGDETMSMSTALEQAVSSVFILSFKMATFYGLYAYFIHTLFSLNVVFVPSVFAALFAAMPFLAPYWVFMPGTVELYFVRSEPIAAVLFFASSLAPMMFVDAVFYKEVKGSHPYLTGLSVVGGIYWLGLEGALIGPMLLCCMLVMLKMYTTMLPK